MTSSKLQEAGEEVGFSWETDYAQSWEVLREDASGSLQPTLDILLQRESEYLQRRRQHTDLALRRGIMRHLILAIDWSCAALLADASPNRGVWTLNAAVRPFIRDFFDQNPLSQIGILILRDGLAEKVSDLSPNLQDHEQALDKLIEQHQSSSDAVAPYSPKGAISLLNCLKVAHSILSHVPNHGTREVLMLQFGLSSQDPGNVFDIIPDLVSSKVRLSVVSCYGEVSVAKKLALQTGGDYSVALNDRSFLDFTREHLSPPLITLSPAGQGRRQASYLVSMGFPSERIFQEQEHVLCTCHGDLHVRGYQCPKCHSLVCQLPVDCPVCRLTLISALHLAKSYHHLFPPPSFKDYHAPLSASENALRAECTGCRQTIMAPNVTKEGFAAGVCSRCENLYCHICNHFIHTVLYNCPSCK